MQISGKVGQRGQGLVVLECCRRSKSFRCDGKVDESVLNVLIFVSESFFGWAVEEYLGRFAICTGSKCL